MAKRIGIRLNGNFVRGLLGFSAHSSEMGGVSIAELLQRHRRDRRIETKKNPANGFWSQLTNACQPKDPTR